MIYGNYALDLCNKPKRHTNITPVDESLIIGYENEDILSEMLFDSVIDNDMTMLEFCNEFADPDVLQEATESLWEKIKNFVKNIIQKIKDFFKMILDKIKGFFGKKKDEANPVDDKGELKPEAKEKMEKKIEKKLNKKESESKEETPANAQKEEPSKKEEENDNSSSEESNESPKEKESSSSAAYPSENLQKSVRERRKAYGGEYGPKHNNKALSHLKYTNIHDVIGMDPAKYDFELKHCSFGNNDVAKGVKNINEYTEKSKQLLEKIKKFVIAVRKYRADVLFDTQSADDMKKLQEEVDRFIETDVNHYIAIDDDDQRYGIWKGEITDLFVDRILAGAALNEKQISSDLKDAYEQSQKILNDLYDYMNSGKAENLTNIAYGSTELGSISKEDKKRGSDYRRVIADIISSITNNTYKIYKSYTTTVTKYINDCHETEEQLKDLLFLKNMEYEKQQQKSA